MRASIVLPVVIVASLSLGIAAWVAGMPQPETVAVVPASVVSAAPVGTAGGAAGAGTGTGAGAGSGGAGAKPAAQGTAAAVGPGTAGSGASPAAGRVVIDEGWLLTTGNRTGIPVRVLQAYASAAVHVAGTTPHCGLSWNTVAAIGDIESGNGTHGGAHIGDDGELVGSILGPVLDGTHATAAVRDSDQGRLDGDSRWDRAIGPMQFLPSTWADHGVDGNGDGRADPNQIDDAAWTTAEYLCAASADVTTADGWTKAIRAYNHDDAYVAAVRDQANAYAREASGR